MGYEGLRIEEMQFVRIGSIPMISYFIEISI